jgi:hypothetical protein
LRLLKDAEARGWTVSKDKKYFKAKCDCPSKCYETIHLTPSDPNYGKNKRNKMAKCENWEGQ